MIKPIQVSASILCADFTKLGAEIKRCEDAGVDMLHVDVMDGHFVPNISIGLPILEAIRPLTKLPIEAHLMMDNPWDYVEPFAKAGADIISIHVECYGIPAIKRQPHDFTPWSVEKIDAAKMLEDIRKIKAAGKKAFAVINPATPLCIDGILKGIDGVLVMSVNPGYARQKFMPEVLENVRKAAKHIDSNGLSTELEIDGGISVDTARQAADAGATVLVVGSAIFHAEDPLAAAKQIRGAAWPDAQ